MAPISYHPFLQYGLCFEFSRHEAISRTEIQLGFNEVRNRCETKLAMPLLSDFPSSFSFTKYSPRVGFLADNQSKYS